MEPRQPSPLLRWLRAVGTAIGAVALALACFLLLPVLEAISATAGPDLELRGIDTAALPPPPPPPAEEQKRDEPPPDAPPPQLAEQAPPLDLTALDLILNPGLGGGSGAGDYTIRLPGVGAMAKPSDELFSLADLDQKPRAVHQQQPQLNAQLRKRTPATVNVIFTVDENGRVENPVVQTSSDPAFDAPTLAAIKQWRFEPGKRAGKPVKFRMRQPMTFK